MLEHGRTTDVLDEPRERATRMAVEAREDPRARAGAVKRIVDQFGMHSWAPRTWVKRARPMRAGAWSGQPVGTRAGDRMVAELPHRLDANS